MMEETISNFFTSFCIPEIQKLEFHLPHVRIIDTNHCGDSRRNAFKRQESFQYLLCFRYYDKRAFVSFSNQIKSEYYGVNRSLPIEGIVL